MVIGLSEVVFVQFFLHLGDPIFLHDQKIAVEFRRRIIVFVVADIGKIAQQPREMDKCWSE